MRRNDMSSLKTLISSVLSLTLAAGLFFSLQKFEKKQFHKLQNKTRNIASIQIKNHATN